MQSDSENWRIRLFSYIQRSIPYLPYLIMLFTVMGILVASFLQNLEWALKGLYLIFPALLASYILQLICKNDLASQGSITLFSYNRKYLSTLFVCLLSTTLIILAAGFGNAWFYPALVVLLYIIILIQVFSNKISKFTLLSEIMLTQAEFIWSSTQKYDFYFGGTDIMPHKFMATITYLSGHVLPPDMGGYAYFPLYHIFIAECSHVLGLNIETVIFSFTWPISVIGVIFVYYIFIHIVRNEQIALLTCLIYSISAISFIHSVYMIPRALAFGGFLMLLYIIVSSKQLKNPYAKCILVMLIGVFTVLVHQVSIFLIIALLSLLIICEWFVGREKYVTRLYFIFLTLMFVSYWIYIAYAFARHTFTSRLDADLWKNPVVLRVNDLLQTDPMTTWSYYINSIGTEVFLFFAIIAIGWILWRKKRDYLTVLAIFALITLVLYMPNTPLYTLWQIHDLLAVNRFQLFLGPFMALIMGVGMYILFQYLLKEKYPIKSICILSIIIIFICGASTTGLVEIDTSIDRNHFNLDEVQGLDFVYKYVPYGSALSTDFYSMRYLDVQYFSESDTLNIPYFITSVIAEPNNVSSYAGYIILPYNEFIMHGLSLRKGSTLDPQNLYSCYPTEENVISLKRGLETRDKLYSNQAIMIYL